MVDESDAFGKLMNDRYNILRLAYLEMSGAKAND